MKYILKKTGFLIITIIIISFLTFLAFNFIPGDAALTKLGTEATPELIAKLRIELGLDDPIFVRYVRWLLNFLHGDFGVSYSYEIPVYDLLAKKIPITMVVTTMSFIVLVVFSIPVALISAYKEDTVIDRIITILNQILMSIPGFFLGIIITYVFGMSMKLFVVGNYVSYEEDILGFMYYLIFPAIAMAIPKTAMGVKMLKSSVLQEKRKNYVKLAFSKGNTPFKVYTKHILRNAILPVMTFWAMTIADLIAKSVIIEQVFTIPGIGRILIQSIATRDYMVVQAIIVIIASVIIIVNYIVDILYKILDPRINIGN